MSRLPLLHDDERLLQRALDLAREAAGLASPNPTVGCVLAINNEILAEAAHLYDNFDHAEIAVLKQAAALGRSVHGATAYVTLEPCAHHGRTGPCAEALIAAGIARVVVATTDPNPQVSGAGIARLRTANIAVDLIHPASPLAQQARRLNDAFAFSIQHHRPFVTLKSAVSLDGYLAPPPHTRTTAEPVWLTGPAARADVHRLRHTSDALLTGVGTLLADNPSLTDRSTLPRRRPLLRIILDTNLRTPPTARLFSTGIDNTVISTEAKRSGEIPAFANANPASTPKQRPNILILCAPEAPETSAGALTTAGAEILRLPTLNNLTAILAELHTRQVRSVLLEAGSNLNGAFLAANLVDRAILYFSERKLGPGSIPFAHGQPSPYALQTTLTSLTRQSFPHADDSPLEDIRITGYLHNPWQSI
jgi:diaminohydroxyphosphoribosylaminopyrimidine deaminase/5-amino-6-(5-phosphoribosylamino)uracil reductase